MDKLNFIQMVAFYVLACYAGWSDRLFTLSKVDILQKVEDVEEHS